MEYRDFSITIEPMREDGTYPVSVRSPAGEDSGVLKLDPSQIGALLTTAGRTRSSGAGTAQRDIQVEALPEEQPSEIGEKLFDALFSDVSSVYERSVGRVEVEKKGLRIKLHIDPTKPSLATLSSLPWELLYQKKNHRHLNLSKSTPVVRYLDLPIPYETVPFDPPLKILVVMANPDGSEALDLTKEREDIEKNWAKADNVEVEFLEKATVARLQDLLARQDYHVIHYMGHGDFDESSGKGVLLMHDETGGRALVTGKKLGMLLLDEHETRLVFLNACNTARKTDTEGQDPFAGVATALVMAGMPAVVAMQFPITDTAAINFSRQFYGELAAGNPVDAAVAEGRKAVSLEEEDSHEWATPVLFMRSEDGRLFDAPKSPDPPPPPPPPPTPMPGRWTDVLRAVGKGAVLAVLYVAVLWALHDEDNRTVVDLVVPTFTLVIGGLMAWIGTPLVGGFRVWMGARGWYLFATCFVLGSLAFIVETGLFGVQAIMTQAVTVMASGVFHGTVMFVGVILGRAVQGRWLQTHPRPDAAGAALATDSHGPTPARD